MAEDNVDDKLKKAEMFIQTTKALEELKEKYD